MAAEHFNTSATCITTTITTTAYCTFPVITVQLLLLLILSPSDTSFAYFKGVENSDIDISNCLVVYLSVLIP